MKSVGGFRSMYNEKQRRTDAGNSHRRRGKLVPLVLAVVLAISVVAAPLLTPDHERFTEEAAQRMTQSAGSVLAPVYAPLAEQLVADYNLDDMETGIGIDLGSGPGTLIFELCARTNLHWINADINPHFFPIFFAEAEKRGFGHRVSAIFADAQALPFRDNYADIIVSRGSYHFWDDKALGFSEIMRVLKPGGVAYIGRGMARDMPVETAQAIREQQGERMVYDREAEAASLEAMFAELGIDTYRIEIPVPPDDPSLNYGIWIELRAP